MWFMVFFDLPTGSKNARFLYSLFRRMLLKHGFSMMQYSVYIKPVPNKEFTQKYEKHIKMYMPEGGQVRTMILSDAQFAQSKSYYGVANGRAERRAIEKQKEDVICLF